MASSGLVFRETDVQRRPGVLQSPIQSGSENRTWGVIEIFGSYADLSLELISNTRLSRALAVFEGRVLLETALASRGSRLVVVRSALGWTKVGVLVVAADVVRGPFVNVEVGVAWSDVASLSLVYRQLL